MKVIIATIKSWNIENAYCLQKQLTDMHPIQVYTQKEELTVENLEKYNPDIIFFPHWSYIIPEEITNRWNCVVFHMTDLPYGRGGSPLQNLIVRGHKDTMLSAIQVTKEIDAGPVYMKKPLSLAGTAQEIYERASKIIFEQMIPQFIKERPKPEEQQGELVVFKRRKPKDGEIKSDMSLETIYDYIRMLDAEGYPNAYLEFGDYRLEFQQAALAEDKVEAKVTFRRRENL
jgi:methionyl-tRNA formyltransferase